MTQRLRILTAVVSACAYVASLAAGWYLLAVAWALICFSWTMLACVNQADA